LHLLFEFSDIRYANGENEVSITAYFTTQLYKEEIISNESREALLYIEQAIIYQKPDIVEVEITSNFKIEHHKCIINPHSKSNEISDEPNGRFNENHDFSRNKYTQNYTSEDVESIVNKLLNEEKEKRECNDIKTKLNKSNEINALKNKTIEKLSSKIIDKDTLIKELQKTIESKSNLEYYSQLTGKALESVGLKKEDIGKLLTGIFSKNNTIEDNNTTIIDDSGIIESN